MFLQSGCIKELGIYYRHSLSVKLDSFAYVLLQRRYEGTRALFSLVVMLL